MGKIVDLSDLFYYFYYFKQGLYKEDRDSDMRALSRPEIKRFRSDLFCTSCLPTLGRQVALSVQRWNVSPSSSCDDRVKLFRLKIGIVNSLSLHPKFTAKLKIQMMNTTLESVELWSSGFSAVCQLSLSSLSAVSQQSLSSLSAVCQLSVFSLSTVCQQSVSSPSVVWQLSVSCLSAVCQLSVRSL